MISPSIWEDPSFNKLSITARLAFIGMISNADDDGYLRGDERGLKRLIFGFDESFVNAWYSELQTYKNLHFFDKDGEAYVHLLNWDKYQAQRDDRRQASIYPKCDICRASDGQVTAEVKEVKEGVEVVKGAREKLKEKWGKDRKT
jgi:hypothetical protein